jgi:NAD(P)H-hydrate epimerase
VDLAGLYPHRKDDARKGDFGRVVVAGGSSVYSGAPAFNALASLRAGADLAFVVAPRRAADLVAGYGPDIITHPCDAGFPEPDAVFAHRPDAIVLGGGVERTPAAHDALREIIRRAACPLVVDAEALHAIAGRPELLRGKRAVLTPHGGEFEAMTGEPWPDTLAKHEEAALRQAARFGATLLVKGRVDVISDGERVALDHEGSPFLTKGGWGDLVAGAAGAFLARGAAPFEAARGAAFLVGAAGARAAASLGESTMASDALPRFAGVIADATGRSRGS